MSKKTFKEMDKEAKEIFLNYFRSTLYINFFDDPNNEFQRCFDSVNYALDHIDPKYSFLLRKEYIDDRSYQWWVNYYSKTTYYRLKAEALEQFLAILK